MIIIIVQITVTIITIYWLLLLEEGITYNRACLRPRLLCKCMLQLSLNLDRVPIISTIWRVARVINYHYKYQIFLTFSSAHKLTLQRLESVVNRINCVGFHMCFNNAVEGC